jgi:hypothetical protein
MKVLGYIWADLRDYEEGQTLYAHLLNLRTGYTGTVVPFQVWEPYPVEETPNVVVIWELTEEDKEALLDGYCSVLIEDGEGNFFPALSFSYGFPDEEMAREMISNGAVWSAEDFKELF